MEEETKQGFKWVLAYCLNGKHEGEFNLMFQGLMDEKGQRNLIFEKYFKTEKQGLKYFIKLKGGFKKQ